ncbi:hypothetical protein [Prochlorococcus sp. MIT 1307]|uniref:hypothetical protein n=1 Tax=Prochlorococcus sp. MIT 1307 TaxID=3096219 RepID=UPI002A7561AF|nr:hypothetical protein [Prochlorococcus sp. MIT 1307]
MIFAILFTLLCITIATVVITVVVWLGFNRESEIAMDISKVIEDISADMSKTYKDLRGLIALVLEIAQPLLNSQVVDVKSEELTDDVEVSET